MPKSRLLENSTNHFDDKELLIPNDNNKKSSDSNINYQQKQLPSTNSTSIEGNVKSTAVNRTNSRSITKRPVSSTASSASIRSNAVLSLEDRDIVIIDTADYEESTTNEANVIVVEKPRKATNHQKPSEDIDLAELLESNWPASAGDLALALNNRSNGTTPHHFSSGSTSTSNSSISCHQATGNSYIFERNRSKNPFSHIGQSKLKRNTGNNTNNFMTTGNLINLDSDGSSASGSFESNHSKY